MCFNVRMCMLFLSNGCPIMHLFKYMAFTSLSFVPVCYSIMYVQASRDVLLSTLDNIYWSAWERLKNCTLID